MRANDESDTCTLTDPVEIDPRPILDWFNDHSAWQAVSVAAGAFGGLCAVILALATALGRSIRNSYINAIATVVLLAACTLAWMDVQGMVPDLLGLELTAGLIGSAFLVAAMTAAPAGARWWIYPVIPAFEIFYFINIVVLCFGTIALGLGFGIPELARHLEPLRDPFLTYISQNAVKPGEICFGIGIVAAITSHLMRKGLIQAATPYPTSGASPLRMAPVITPLSVKAGEQLPSAKNASGTEAQ